MRIHAAKVRAIWPQDTYIETLYGNNAYCGLSLSNPNFYGSRLVAIIKYLTNNFHMSLLLTTGYIYRLHHRLFCDSDEEALKLACKQEQLYIKEELLPTLNQLDSRTKERLKFVQWYDIHRSGDVQYKKIQDFYKVNEEFHQAINDVAVTFLNSKNKDQYTFACSAEEALQFSIKFLLEESAIFDYLVRLGYKTDVYPGIALPALRDLNRVRSAPDGLKKRSVVELSLLRRGRKRKQKCSIIVP